MATSPTPTPSTAPTAAPTAPSVPPATTSPTSSLAASVEPIGSVLYQEPPEAGPVPVTLTIAGIGVDLVPVVEVGVLEDGDMEIPGADEIGWYRFGPRPGEAGVAVLAAHIAYNGRSGVFGSLARIDPGDVVEVGFADGTSRRFS
ncbi:hypothetical protein BH23ACT5_BH23ACT5_02500 [soil metagenome]